ncbi:unnamed protein product [Owenia fusiformis]|uniref:Sodium channel modifier 1 n=1 Tax=Owenia fusiformis TaxID=6347 RepID=A0A8J1TAB4_OWEFU|nr:unnamed protein product [Owenia fusiformis]
MATLRSIQKRRVDELFAEDIPEDEVIVMNTGRYSCKVCHHRPVFDTVNVLALHRSSKKHLQNLEQKKAEDTDLFNMVAKRKHEQFMKDGTVDIQIAPEVKQRVDNIAGHVNNTVQVQAYDPRVKKPKVNRHQRRPKISVESAYTSNQDSLSTDVPSTEHSKPSLLGMKLALNIGKHTDPIEVNPYIRKQSKIQPQSNPRKSKSFTDEKPCLLHKLESLKSKAVSANVTDSESSTSKRLKKEPTMADPPMIVHNPETQRKAEHYLKLRESGWMKDKSGNWIKDENVEFDSDEEEPPATP